MSEEVRELVIPSQFRDQVKSGWLAVRTLFFCGHVPSSIKSRLSMQQATDLLLERELRPEWSNLDDLATAAAVMSAESLRDKRAYNVRVELPPGEFMLTDKNRRVVFRSSGYEKIKTHLDAEYPWNGPTTMATLQTHLRRDLECTIAGFDIGLMQCNNDYWNAPLKVGTDPEANVTRGYEIFTNRSNTWNAWYTFTGGTHKRFMPEALECAKKSLA